MLQTKSSFQMASNNANYIWEHYHVLFLGFAFTSSAFQGFGARHDQ